MTSWMRWGTFQRPTTLGQAMLSVDKSITYRNGGTWRVKWHWLDANGNCTGNRLAGVLRAQTTLAWFTTFWFARCSPLPLLREYILGRTSFAPVVAGICNIHSITHRIVPYCNVGQPKLDSSNQYSTIRYMNNKSLLSLWIGLSNKCWTRKLLVN